MKIIKEHVGIKNGKKIKEYLNRFNSTKVQSTRTDSRQYMFELISKF